MSDRPKNALLRSLPPADYERLRRSLRPVALERSQTIFEPEEEVDYVYFPERGFLSLLTVMRSGDTVETAIVGCEGAVGFIEAAGGGVIFSRCVVQAPGAFHRMPARDYRQAFAESEPLRRTLRDYIELLVAEARQTIACISQHGVEQRLAWWLLESQDRIGGDERLPLTQEFLAAMLGVRRSTVSEVAGRLQAEGLIRYRRGMIEVLDRARLERAACECYATTQAFRRRIEDDAARSAA